MGRSRRDGVHFDLEVGVAFGKEGKEALRKIRKIWEKG